MLRCLYLGVHDSETKRWTWGQLKEQKAGSWEVLDMGLERDRLSLGVRGQDGYMRVAG